VNVQIRRITRYGYRRYNLKKESKAASNTSEVETGQVDYTVRFIHGEPGPSIVKYTNDGEFDVVVIGSRGLNGVQELVLGGVSHKVVKRANCPVLIVK